MSRVNRANKKIKVGDTVKVIAGKDSAGKGKVGKVIKIIAKNNRAIVEKVNMVKKHQKGDDQGKQGGIVEKEASIHLSNITLLAGVKKDDSKKTEAKKTVAKTTTKKSASKKTTKKTSKKAASKE